MNGHARIAMQDDPSEAIELTSLHVQRARGGNEESLGWIIARFTPLLVAQASYRLGERLRRIYDSRDLVHDAWLVALPRLSELTARDGRYTPVLLRFMSTTLLNTINNLVRRHEKASAKNVVFDDPPADRTGLVSALVRKEERSIVLRCIEELGDRDREILIMRGIEQQTNATIGMILQLEPKAVGMRYARALERLRERLPGSIFDQFEMA